ncbi:MAG: S-adenosyl-l-methionine hydroxide adenosyltransferase family protein [Halanaeroarchaeum sp.]
MLTLSSDFGSPYPAAMKGVILHRTDARLVDVSHTLPRQDVRAAAFWLRQVLPEFPPAVHLVVVDPGVGTERDVVAVRAGDHVLVGPDNGVLVPPARAIAPGDLTVYVAEEGDPESDTFHGRDVFAPLAADVHEGGVDRLERDGAFERTDAYETIEFPRPEREGDVVRGTVLVVDDFGNAITNVPGDWIEHHLGEAAIVGDRRVPIRRTYAALDPHEALITIGSHGNVELAVNRGRGSEAFAVGPGDAVVMTLGASGD